MASKSVAWIESRGTLNTIVMPSEEQVPSFFGRIGLAWRVFVDSEAATKLAAILKTPEPIAPPVEPPEKVHASGLFVLSALQQEGRFLDFVRQDIASFSDEDIGAAARVVHSGCKKAVEKYLVIAPVLKDEEGAKVTVPTGFDSNRIRLTGNVTGNPPFKGVLKHHGWVATQLQFPSLNPDIDHRVIAPAEVELS